MIDPVRRGESRAFWEEALVDVPRHPYFYAPDGTPWCRFGAGFRCLNDEVCRNPNHRRT